MLRAASIQTIITPEKPSFLLGYPHVPRTSIGTHDDLTAQILYLQNNGKALLIASLDLLMLDKAKALSLRKRLAEAVALPEECVFIGCTHTHSGPVTVDYLPFHADPIVPDTDMDYLECIFRKICKDASSLPQKAIPAELAWTSAAVSGVGGNRISPEDASNPEAGILAVRSLESKALISVVMNYSVHPTVLHEDSRLFSADYPGFARQELRDRYGAAIAIPFLLGAAGNQSPRYYVKGQTFAEAERLGRRLGSFVAEALEKVVTDDGCWQSNPVLNARISLVELVKREFPDVATAKNRLAEAVATYERLKSENAGHGKVRTAECTVFGAEESVFLAECGENGRLQAVQEEYRLAQQQSLRIGDVCLAGLPGECFVEYALSIIRRASRRTFVATLVNGELQGYMVTPEAEAQGGYEAWNACFSPVSGERLVESALKSIKEL